jgi:cysteine-rich repeat protein
VLALANVASPARGAGVASPPMRSLGLRSFLAGSLLLAACSYGDNLKPTGDGPPDAEVADPPDAEPFALCGNSIIEPGEQCDDGDTEADVLCDADCQLSCGNGALEPGEACDTAVTAGDGLCPASCDDADSCTSDILLGGDCQASCLNTPITENVAGDSCCLPGATSVDDADCPAACGNAVIESGEVCDTGIAAGDPGACPTTCGDGIACTADALVGDGTCGAACTNTPITAPANGDGCCPSGATSANDNDCTPSCGNGVVGGGETCDIAIAAGSPGACPTSCADANACTTDLLVAGGTCTAACSNTPITAPVAGDSCCPAGQTSLTDADCAPVCGNSLVEAGEQCDDGNGNPSDGCDMCMTVSVVTPTAFRFTDLDLRDPHVVVDGGFFLGCRDVTDQALLGFAVNGELQASITDFSLNPTLVFRPLQQAMPSGPMDLYFGQCAAGTPPSCMPGADPPVSSTATNTATGTTPCLGVIEGTTYGPYTPEVVTPGPACFVSDPETLTINVSGIPIELSDAQIAATYVGSPAGTLVNGLIRGFISEADADATILPADLALIGGDPLSSVLPGGTNNCASHSAKDVNNGVTGWWFYLNFSATKVNWSEP